MNSSNEQQLLIEQQEEVSSFLLPSGLRDARQKAIVRYYEVMESKRHKSEVKWINECLERWLEAKRLKSPDLDIAEMQGTGPKESDMGYISEEHGRYRAPDVDAETLSEKQAAGIAAAEMIKRNVPVEEAMLLNGFVRRKDHGWRHISELESNQESPASVAKSGAIMSPERVELYLVGVKRIRGDEAANKLRLEIMGTLTQVKKQAALLDKKNGLKVLNGGKPAESNNLSFGF